MHRATAAERYARAERRAAELGPCLAPRDDARQPGRLLRKRLGSFDAADVEQAALCEMRFEDCPHAAPHRYCAECPVKPCPIGLGRP